MSKRRFFYRFAAVVVALMLLAAFAVPAAAVQDSGDTPDTNIGEGEAAEGAGEDATTEAPADDPAAEPTEDQPGATEEQPDEDPDDGDPDEEPDDAQSTYTEPEHLDELPELEDGEVVPATSVAVPAATVSDASLLSGIVMWLCVAVGIAVVVGVMVSKRTRRGG